MYIRIPNLIPAYYESITIIIKLIEFSCIYLLRNCIIIICKLHSNAIFRDYISARKPFSFLNHQNGITHFFYGIIQCIISKASPEIIVSPPTVDPYVKMPF